MVAAFCRPKKNRKKKKKRKRTKEKKKKSSTETKQKQTRKRNEEERGKGTKKKKQKGNGRKTRIKGGSQRSDQAAVCGFLNNEILHATASRKRAQASRKVSAWVDHRRLVESPSDRHLPRAVAPECCPFVLKHSPLKMCWLPAIRRLLPPEAPVSAVARSGEAEAVHLEESSVPIFPCWNRRLQGPPQRRL